MYFYNLDTCEYVTETEYISILSDFIKGKILYIPNFNISNTIDFPYQLKMDL